MKKKLCAVLLLALALTGAACGSVDAAPQNLPSPREQQTTDCPDGNCPNEQDGDRPDGNCPDQQDDDCPDGNCPDKQDNRITPLPKRPAHPRFPRGGKRYPIPVPPVMPVPRPEM